MKYRPTVVMNDDTAKDVLRELRTLSKDSPEQLAEAPEPEKSALDQVNEILTSKLDE